MPDCQIGSSGSLEGEELERRHDNQALHRQGGKHRYPGRAVGGACRVVRGVGGVSTVLDGGDQQARIETVDPQMAGSAEELLPTFVAQNAVLQSSVNKPRKDGRSLPIPVRGDQSGEKVGIARSYRARLPSGLFRGSFITRPIQLAPENEQCSLERRRVTVQSDPKPTRHPSVLAGCYGRHADEPSKN